MKAVIDNKRIAVWFEQVASFNCFQLQNSGLYNTIDLHPDLGVGSFHFANFKNSFFITMLSFRLKSPWLMDMRTHENHLDLTFCLEGGIDCYTPDYNLDLSVAPKQLLAFHGSNVRMIPSFSANKQYTILTITLLPDFVSSLELDNKTDETLLATEPLVPIGQKGPITTEMSYILHQIINNRHNGLAQKFFFRR